ncbi:dynein light chain roadblock-type [Nesidiocoris tenuis]|uniref:Dynein light chain roadblock-type n=1 Tax=Nesidiocoris tenuis TaxID=355587 RepID=A0ABN7BAF1_9HEMI|nr:dynein light chain roadblock-type [Nesidiocoris tenuis]
MTYTVDILKPHIEKSSFRNNFEGIPIVRMAEDDISPIMGFHHLDVRALEKAAAKIMKRIQKNDLVLDTLVIHKFGLPGETTMSTMMATTTARVLKPFVTRCVHTTREVNPSDTPLTIRVSTTNYEILIIPEKEFTLVAFHRPLPAPFLPYSVKTSRKR